MAQCIHSFSCGIATGQTSLCPNTSAGTGGLLCNCTNIIVVALCGDNSLRRQNRVTLGTFRTGRKACFRTGRILCRNGLFFVAFMLQVLILNFATGCTDKFYFAIGSAANLDGDGTFIPAMTIGGHKVVLKCFFTSVAFFDRVTLLCTGRCYSLFFYVEVTCCGDCDGLVTDDGEAYTTICKFVITALFGTSGIINGVFIYNFGMRQSSNCVLLSCATSFTSTNI